MNILWSPRAWDDYQRLQSVDRAMIEKINSLITAIRREPFTGIGKPEPLKSELSCCWSRRITGEHRLVYRVTGKGSEQRVEILSCQYHY